MHGFARLSSEERKEVFQAVSVSRGLRPDIIEKDFWVCFLLAPGCNDHFLPDKLNQF